MIARVTRDDVFALLAVARIGACAVSAEGKLVFWNHAAERILGLPAAQVLGRRCDEIIVETADTDAYSSWNGSEGRYAGCISRPVTALMLCGSGDHRQIVLTPIVVADRPGGDALALYVFDEPSGIQPVGPDGQGVPERSPEPQSGPVPTPAGHATSSPSPHGLTRREIEILRLVALGTATDQIASDLGISIHTVRNHVRSLRGKLDARTKLDAVVTAMRHGLL